MDAEKEFEMKKFLMTVCVGLLSLGLWADSVTTNGVTWTFSVSDGRATLFGKAALDDADWTPVTDANLAGMHFFKVVVEKAAAGE